MPDLATLPSEATVFVDTIIFDLHYRGKSAECERFLRRVAAGDVTAYVNTLVLTDLMHKLMLADAFQQGIIAERSAKKMREALNGDRSLAAKLVDCHQQFRATLRIGLRVRQITKDLLVRSQVHRQGQALLTGDSLHLETMLRVGVLNVVTYDSDFANVAGITVWSPTDVMP